MSNLVFIVVFFREDNLSACLYAVMLSCFGWRVIYFFTLFP